MKGGSHNPTISQFSLILIGLVSATVLILTWTKTTSLTSSIPTDSHVMQLRRDEVGPKQTLQRNNSSEHSETKEVTLPDSSNLEYSVYETNTNNLTTEPKKEICPSILENSGTEEAFDGESKHKQVDLQLSSPKNYSTPESSVENSSVAAKNKDCNYGKGSWITDDKRPLYSGFDCKQWLSPMWACRLTQRTDFGYEKLRWQPKECKMEDFTGSKFLKRMQDKTLAFVGDSLGRQQFQSLMCMATGGKEKPIALDVGPEYGFAKADGAARPSGWAYRFPTTNTTIIYYWSASLCDIVPINTSNPDTSYAMHLDRPPEFLRHFLHKFDVLVLNTGHHWNRGKLNANRWNIYVGGVPNTDRKYSTIGDAKDFAVHSIVKWVNSQLPLNPGLKAFFRSISPRHFFNGEWNTGGTCDNTTPLAGGKEVLKNDSNDPLAADAVQGTDVKLLDITALSELRDEGHISRYSIKATPGVQDCLHWCLPGVPDAWNEILFAQI